MAQHSTPARWWDKPAAYIGAVAGRKPGRHALPSTITSGADLAWGLVLRAMNKEPVMRPEVRA